MKHVPRGPAAPPAMAAYVAAHPTDTNATGTDAGKAWERFRNDEAYGELRQALVTAQRGLCGYCEQRLTQGDGGLFVNNQQIEHMLAKTGGPGRVLDPSNLMLCCGGGCYREKDRSYFDSVRHYDGDANVSCGQRKGDGDLGVGCDPRTFPGTPSLVNVALDGKITANDVACRAAGVDPIVLNDTIKRVLNLNCERLRVAREKRLRAITEEFLWLAGELFKRTTLPDAARLSVGESLVEGRLAPDTHGYLRAFWSVERQYLAPWSESWIRKNAQRVGFP